MTIHTLFVSPLHQAFNKNVGDPSEAETVTRLMGDVRHNVLYAKIEQFQIDNTETRSISLANYTQLSDWPFIIMRVVGEAKLSTVGVDTDNSTGITGEMPAYGTSKFPGILIFSTYNVQTFTVESLADDTTVELFAGIAAEDDDSRLDDNA